MDQDGSARFETVLRRIQRKEFVDLFWRFFASWRFGMYFFRGRRRNERERPTSVFKTDGSFKTDGRKFLEKSGNGR